MLPRIILFLWKLEKAHAIVALLEAMRFGFRFRHISYVIAAAVASIGCGDGDTQIIVKYASDYARPAADISILGIVENGRLSPAAWQELGHLLSSRFSQSTCETLWNDNFMSANPTLASSIDEYTKDDGVTDELLERLAPMAKGGSILAFTVVGRQMASSSDGGNKPVETTPSPLTRPGGGFPARGGGGRGMRGNFAPQSSTSDDQKAEMDSKTYKISATLFSNRLRHSVVVVAMSYSGPNIDLAMKEFIDKLRSNIPNVACTGWNLDAHIDVGSIRELPNQQVPEPFSE